MRFKFWLNLSETLDAQTKGSLLQDKSPKDELLAFIKELEDEPNLIDRKTAFTKLRQRFPLIKQNQPKKKMDKLHFIKIN